MIRFDASNISRCYFLNKRKLKKLVNFVFKSLGITNARFSLVFATDAEIKRLNYLYRRKNRPTDVLSFSMNEGKRLKKDTLILGDIVISLDRARVEARRFNSSFKKETYLYIIHGILHLLGYCDEEPISRKKMQKKETQILNSLCKRLKQ